MSVPTQELPLAGRTMAYLGQQVRAHREQARALRADRDRLADALGAIRAVLDDPTLPTGQVVMAVSDVLARVDDQTGRRA